MNLGNKSDIADLRVRLQNSVAALAADLDLRITVGSCRYEGSGDGLVFKLEIERDDALPKFERDLRERFGVHADAGDILCGLTHKHLGKKFVINGKAHTLVGLKGRVQSKPIIGRCASNGRMYRFEMWDVAEAFGIEQTIHKANFGFTDES